jgi:hypothetical protein
MKRFFTLLTFLTFAFFANAQLDSVVITAGSITSNTTWSSDKIYVLDSYTYVIAPAVLTIEPGTIIKGRKGTKASLIITSGAKIEAKGTAERPIVFTSNQAPGSRNVGDWGGIIILGKATINQPDCSTCPGASVAATEPGNQRNIEGDLDNAQGWGLYGGNDDADNSGTLQYVRLEFGGIIITPGNEINGITMGGVGSGTTIDHVQVSYVDDDGFEWFGGTVNASHLISYRNVDDDFDTDYGYRGNVQFIIAQRDSNLFDRGSGPTTNGFESDNDGSGSTASPQTAPVFSNVTFVGPIRNNTDLADATNSFQYAGRIRRNSALSVFNSVFIDFPRGYLIDGNASYDNYTGDTMMIKNCVFAGALPTRSLLWTNATTPATAQADFEATFATNNNDTIRSSAGLIANPYSRTNPNFASIGAAVATGASFTGAKISNSFFTPTTYKGAIGSMDWTAGWTEYDPQNADYSGLANVRAINAINTINVFPNPAQNVLTITVGATQNFNASIEVVNISGQVVVPSQNINFNLGTNNNTVDISNLNNGVYVLRIVSANGVKSQLFNVIK